MVGLDITTISTFTRPWHSDWIQKGSSFPLTVPAVAGDSAPAEHLCPPGLLWAQRLNTERRAASGTVAAGDELPDSRGARVPVHHGSLGAQLRPPSPGRGALRRLFFLYSINQKPPRSPVVLSLSVLIPLSRSPSLCLSLILPLSESLCRLNWFYYCDGHWC